jgi:N-acetyl-gamma-glutamyl-phosphate reductase
MQLAVVPAARAGALDRARPWILFGVTGSSGSGNAPKLGTHHPFRDGNLWVYSLGGHRHEAELAQALAPSGPIPTIQFNAASGPFVRGIHMSAWLPLARGLDASAARAIYADAYANEPFVEVLAEGVPDLRRVVGSNRASLAVSVRGGVLTVLLTLDNLVKGGAGQGLQCLNRMLGFPESWGLPRAGLGVS